MEAWPFRGVTPLIIAAIEGTAGLVKTLIKYKAKHESAISSGIFRGATALIAAASAKRTSAATTLLDCHANVEAKVMSCWLIGVRPMHAAALMGGADTVAVLHRAGASLWPPLLWWLFPPLLPLPLPPILLASFSSVAVILISAILGYFMWEIGQPGDSSYLPPSGSTQGQLGASSTDKPDLSSRQAFERVFGGFEVPLLCFIPWLISALVDLPRVRAFCRIAVLCCSRRKRETAHPAAVETN